MRAGGHMTSKEQAPRPTVVVVGGGYGGIAVAKALDEMANVVLVEPKDAFMHNVAALRALVDPTWLPPDLPALRRPSYQRPGRAGSCGQGRARARRHHLGPRDHC